MRISRRTALLLAANLVLATGAVLMSDASGATSAAQSAGLQPVAGFEGGGLV